jgi:hypothetical protein
MHSTQSRFDVPCGSALPTDQYCECVFTQPRSKADRKKAPKLKTEKKRTTHGGAFAVFLARPERFELPTIWLKFRSQTVNVAIPGQMHPSAWAEPQRRCSCPRVHRRTGPDPNGTILSPRFRDDHTSTGEYVAWLQRSVIQEPASWLSVPAYFAALLRNYV